MFYDVTSLRHLMDTAGVNSPRYYQSGITSGVIHSGNVCKRSNSF